MYFSCFYLGLNHTQSFLLAFIPLTMGLTGIGWGLAKVMTMLIMVISILLLAFPDLKTQILDFMYAIKYKEHNLVNLALNFYR